MTKSTKVFYIISHPEFDSWYSIGVATNIKNRLSVYQTHSPDRSFKLEYFIAMDDSSDLEMFIKHLCEKKGVSNGYEWVRCSLEYLKGAVEAFMFSLEGGNNRSKFTVFSDGEEIGEYTYLRQIAEELNIPYYIVLKMNKEGYYPKRYEHIQIEKN